MNKKIVRTGMILISYIALLALIVVYFKEILSGVNLFLGYATPFVIGLVIAFFLNPVYRLFMKLFNKIKFPELIARLLSTILVILFASGLITGITMIVIPQVTSNFKNFFSNFDEYLASFQRTLDNITEQFNIETFDLNVIVTFIEELGTNVQNSITEWGPQAFNYTKKIISSITGVLIGIIFSIYILNARDRLLRQINRLTFALFPEKGYKILHHIGEVMLKTFDNYVVGQSIEAMILGTLCYLGMLSFNFSYPGLISVVVAITALVPIVGTIVGGAVGFFLYLLVDPVKALIFLIFFTVLQQLENNLIYPKVVGTKIGLPGLWVLFAVMIGSQIGGLIGILFGVPIFTIIYTLIKDFTLLKEKEKLDLIDTDAPEEFSLNEEIPIPEQQQITPPEHTENTAAATTNSQKEETPPPPTPVKNNNTKISTHNPKPSEEQTPLKSNHSSFFPRTANPINRVSNTPPTAVPNGTLPDKDTNEHRTTTNNIAPTITTAPNESTEHTESNPFQNSLEPNTIPSPRRRTRIKPFFAGKPKNNKQ